MKGVSEAGLVFRRSVRIYLSAGVSEEYVEALHHAEALESRGDDLRRGMEAQLYEQTLIPDLRADVLRHLEDLDWPVGICQANCYRFSIEKPDIPMAYDRDFMDLTETAVTCTDCLAMASRAFFRNVDAVPDWPPRGVRSADGSRDGKEKDIIYKISFIGYESDIENERRSLADRTMKKRRPTGINRLRW